MRKAAAFVFLGESLTLKIGMRADQRLSLRHGFCLLQAGANLLECLDQILFSSENQMLLSLDFVLY